MSDVSLADPVARLRLKCRIPSVRVPCQGLIYGMVRLQTRTKPCGIRAHIDTALLENQDMTDDWSCVSA